MKFLSRPTVAYIVTLFALFRMETTYSHGATAQRALKVLGECSYEADLVDACEGASSECIQCIIDETEAAHSSINSCSDLNATVCMELQACQPTCGSTCNQEITLMLNCFNVGTNANLLDCDTNCNGDVILETEEAGSYASKWSGVMAICVSLLMTTSLAMNEAFCP